MADIGGVEFLLQLNAKLDQATRMTRELTKTEAALNKADAAMKKAEKSSNLLNRAMGAVASKTGQFVRDMLSQFTALASFDFAKGLVTGTLALGKSLIMAAAGAEKTSRAFRVLFGDEQARRMEEAADMLAKRTQFDDDKIKTAFQELGAAGLKPLQIIDAVAVAADAAARTGNAGAFDGLIDAVKQMQALGRVPRGLGAFGLAEGAGKMIEKEIKQGTKALDAFFKVVDKTSKTPIFGAALERGKDLDVTLAKISDLPSQFGQQLAGTAGYERLKDAAAGLLAAFDPDGPRGKEIVTALSSSLGRIGDLLKRIDVGAVADSFTRLAKALPGLVDRVSLLVESLAKLFGWAVRLLELYDKANKGAGEAGKGAPTKASVAQAFQPTIFEKVVGGLFPMAEPALLAERVLRAQREARRIGEATSPAMADGMVSGVPAVTKASEKVADAAETPVKEGLGIQSPSRVFAALGMQTAAGFAMGVGAAVPDLQRTVGAAFSPLALLPAGGYGVAAGAAMAGGGSGGQPAGPTFEAHITVNMGTSTGDARRDAEVTAATIAEGLEAWLAQRAAQTGGT